MTTPNEIKTAIEQVCDLLDVTIKEQCQTMHRKHTLWIKAFLASCMFAFAVYLVYVAITSEYYLIAIVIALICATFPTGIKALLEEAKSEALYYRNLAFKRTGYLKRLQELLGEDCQ